MNTQKIYSLIPKIMEAVGHISKDRKTQGGQVYAFRGIDDVYAALQAPLIKYGVFFAPTVLSHTREERESKNGGNLIYTVLVVEFKFYADDGSSFSTTTMGEAMDSSDKSCNKAMSAALKVMALQLFCIPTEGDNDTENNTHEVKGKPRSVAVSGENPALTAPPFEVNRMINAFALLGVTPSMINAWVGPGPIKNGHIDTLRGYYDLIKTGGKVTDYFKTDAQLQVAATLAAASKANKVPVLPTIPPEEPLDFTSAPTNLVKK